MATMLASSSKRLLSQSNSKCLCSVPRQQKRRIHRRPALHFDAAQGMQPFLSAKALDNISQYQDGLLIRLNDAVKGTPWEQSSVMQTVISTAADRNHALTFNLASHALNTSYFLSKLTQDKARQSVGSSAERLHSHLGKSFGSFTQFKHAFSSSALGMSGSGYLWLVMDDSSRLGIVGTYGGGTVLVQSRQQRGEYSELPQEADTPAPTEEPSALHEEPSSNPSPLLSSHRPTSSPSSPTTTRSASTFQPNLIENLSSPTNVSQAKMPQLHPLFCLSMHEHCWLPDYGVWGQEEYLARFWNVLDWSAVGGLYERLMPRNAESFKKITGQQMQ